jgi:hypothetical protein
MILFAKKYSSDTVLFSGIWHAYVKFFGARRVQIDHRRVEGVGGGGGKPGSNARARRSLRVGRHVDVELTQGGAARHRELGGLSRHEERRCLAVGLSSR